MNYLTFLKISLWFPNNLSRLHSNDAAIFEGMSVFGGKTVFCDFFY